MDDLEGFPNNSVGAIYSSHTLEHNAIGDGTLHATLQGRLTLSIVDIT